MADKLNQPLYEVEIVEGFSLYFKDILTFDNDKEGWGNGISPEKAREMKSIIDLYLYSLYIKEANI